MRTISKSARSMMLHVIIYWPNEIHLSLWPFAMEYSIYLWNHMLGIISDIAPIKVLSGTRLDSRYLCMAHVWGVPCYVLDLTF